MPDNFLKTLLQCIYILVIFFVLDHEVQVALGNRRADLKEAKRRKVHEVKVVEEDLPDWVKNTRTRARSKVVTAKVSH